MTTKPATATPKSFPVCSVCGDRIRTTYGLPVHTKGMHDHAAVAKKEGTR